MGTSSSLPVAWAWERPHPTCIVVVVPPHRVGLGDVQDDGVGFARARFLVHDPGAVIGNLIDDIQRLQVSGVRHCEGLDELRRKHELGASRQAREKLLVGNKRTKHTCSACARCDLVGLPLVVHDENLATVCAQQPLVVQLNPQKPGLLDGQHCGRDADPEALPWVNRRREAVDGAKLQQLVVRLDVDRVLVLGRRGALEIDTHQRLLGNFVCVGAH